MSAPALSGEFDVIDYLDKTYITIGAGYKFKEATMYFDDKNGNPKEFNEPISARIEIGYRYNKNIRFGISHHSQWLTGWPVNNDRNEYEKTEFFIDYTFTVGSLFW